MFYRIKQFLWALTSTFKTLDYEYIDTYLNNEEKVHFLRLIKSEQEHCLRVSKDLMISYGENSDFDKTELIRLGLLHDLGKNGLRFGPFKKTIFVMFKKRLLEYSNKYEFLKVIRLYYNHPVTGVNILREIKSNSYTLEFLEAIEKHHLKSDGKENKYLTVLKICDDRN